VSTDASYSSLQPYMQPAATSGITSATVCSDGGSCLQNTVSTAAKTGSGLWVGPTSVASVTGCTLTDNEAYGAESNYEKANIVLKNCTLAGNSKGESDTWKGGRLTKD
jgi:hypothetical protein